MDVGRVLTATERYLEKLRAKADSDRQTFKVAVVGTGVLLCAAGAYVLIKSKKNKDQSTPGLLGLSGGSAGKTKSVKETFKEFTQAYETAGEGIQDQEKAPEVTDAYYTLATDFYEWGWGSSFHFSPPLPGKTQLASEVAHEARVAGLLGLKPGMTCIDCGCGVGGPMRTIAAVSGAKILGVTINQYQVDRANRHNEKMKSTLCTAVQGSFLDLKSENNVFDAAYAIEATCHAPTLEEPFAEIFRVLKPGAKFVSYEWLKTDKFDGNNSEHQKIINDICIGNGLPNIRTIYQALQAAKTVGFEVIDAYDLAFNVGGGEWYDRLVAAKGKASHFNNFLINLFSFLRLLPEGVKEVHDMLFNHAASGCISAGEQGIFTPMYLMVLRKPESA